MPGFARFALTAFLAMCAAMVVLAPGRTGPVATPKPPVSHAPRIASDADLREILRVLLAEFEDYQLWDALDVGAAKPGKKQTGPAVVVVLNTTAALCTVTPMRDPLGPCISPQLERTLLEADRHALITLVLRKDLLAANRRSVALPRGGVPGARYVTRSQVRSILEHPPAPEIWDWLAFRRTFPRSPGHLETTRAVLTRDGRHALVYVQRSCGPMCGGGVLHLLARDGATWVRVDSARLRSH